MSEIISIVGLSGSSGTTNASDLTEGTLADGRLSGNVALKNAANTWSVVQTFGAGFFSSGAEFQPPSGNLDLILKSGNGASVWSFFVSDGDGSAGWYNATTNTTSLRVYAGGGSVLQGDAAIAAGSVKLYRQFYVYSVLGNDATAGIQFDPDATGSLAFCAGGAGAFAEKMRLTSAGRLGVGEPDPAYPVEVNNATYAGGLQRWAGAQPNDYYLDIRNFVPTGSHVAYAFDVRTNGGATLYSNNLVIDRGRIGVGITPTQSLDVNGAALVRGNDEAMDEQRAQDAVVVDESGVYDQRACRRFAGEASASGTLTQSIKSISMTGPDSTVGMVEVNYVVYCITTNQTFYGRKLMGFRYSYADQNITELVTMSETNQDPSGLALGVTLVAVPAAIDVELNSLNSSFNYSICWWIDFKSLSDGIVANSGGY